MNKTPPNQPRQRLENKLPLDSPFSVHIFPSYYCNFKCGYCIHSLPEETLKSNGFKRQFMNLDVCFKAIDDIAQFPYQLKALIFAGHGEPLVHKDISKMVAYAKKLKVAERIEIVTNGYLLTSELSDKLIEANLDRLKVSIQGLSAEKYKEISGVDINFNTLIENLRYFYEHKKSTTVYIKIVDASLDQKEDENKFYELFDGMCDEIAVEYIVPLAQEIDHSKYGTDFTKSKEGYDVCKVSVCQFPFFMMVVTPNGDVLPCCSTTIPYVSGNIKKKSLVEIWNSAELRAFYLMHLEGKRNCNAVCKKCNRPDYGMQDGDNIDSSAERLIKLYRK